MVPWLMALAGTLAAKSQSGSQQDQLAADIARRNAQRLGGNTDMLDAVAGQNAAKQQEGRSIGAALASSLVGNLGNKTPEAPPMAAAAPAATGLTAGGAINPLAAGPMAAQSAGMNAMFNDPEMQDYLRKWGR